MSDLTYKNKNDDTVYTSTYLKNRGSCCKTKCLHCPYGYTLKMEGLVFEKVSNEKMQEAQLIIDSNRPKKSISDSLLAGAFNPQKKSIKLCSDSVDRYYFIKLKNQVCGLIENGNFQAKNIYLLKHFKEQGLSLDIVGAMLADSESAE